MESIGNGREEKSVEEDEEEDEDDDEFGIAVEVREAEEDDEDEFNMGIDEGGDEARVGIVDDVSTFSTNATEDAADSVAAADKPVPTDNSSDVEIGIEYCVDGVN